MEHRAPLKILPVEMMDGDFLLFPSLFNFTATSFLFFLDKFCYNHFQYIFKPRGASNFLQTNALIFKEHLDSTMFHYYCTAFQLLSPQKWTKSYKGKFLDKSTK